MLGVHETHQKRGIGASLIEWGTKQADSSNLETYLDGSAYARPYYIEHHGFEAPGMVIPIPDR
jgi:predicted N-acetyltransferase YhbS